MTDPVPSKDLLPCPFCGGEPRWCADEEHTYTCHRIICSACMISIDFNDDPDGVETVEDLQGLMAANWNSRAAPEPAHEYPDPVTAFEKLAEALPDGFQFPTMEPNNDPLTHMEILSAVHHHASEIVRLTAAVPVECPPQPPRDE